MTKKIIFVTGEGIGNTIQCIPVIRTLKEVLGYEIDMWHSFGTFPIPHLIPYADKWISDEDINKIDVLDYNGIVSTFWTRNKITFLLNKGIKLLNKITPLSMNRSEVDTYMDIARNLGVKEEDIIWHGECSYKKTNEKYDIVIHDGYNKSGSANWSIKSYPYYKEVTQLLIKDGFSVCSVGAGNEYIKGAVNRTGLDLLSSLGLIKNSRLFLGNDSGLYHCANALGMKNIVIFTATSIKKNYDEKFHKYSTIIGRDDLKCRPCQANRRWNNGCSDWECRNISPNTVMNKIKELLI